MLARVIVSFRDKGAEDLFDGRDTKQARKACPSDLVRVAWRKLDQLNQATVLGDLRAPPSNRMEKLTGERGGQCSIRINDQWRVCFRWADSGAEDVEIADYH
jgi:proteic killer suppression protein